MPEITPEAVGEYLDIFWEREPGKVYLATSDHGQNFRQAFAQWPAQRNAVIQSALAGSAKGLDVWFCPSVFEADAPKPEKQYIKSVRSRWIDFDGNAPKDWEASAKEKGIPVPTMRIRSSVEGHEHAHWLTERTTDIDAVENTNRALSATFLADMSGWDATQLLRIPGTMNYGHKAPDVLKPWYTGEPVPVVITDYKPGVIVDDAEFSTLRSIEKAMLDKIVITEFPPVQQVLALAEWSLPLLEIFNYTKQEASDASPDKRSGTLQRLAYMLAEHKFTDEQMYSVLEDCDRRWEKYTQRSKAGRDKILRDTIAKARAKVGYFGDELTLAGIMGVALEDLKQSSQIVYSFGEFMEQEFKVDWMLDGLLQKRGMGLLVGQPGVGKSTLGLQIGFELAIGQDRILCWDNVAGPAKVLMLSCEMGPHSLSHFVHNLGVHYKDFVRELGRNLFLAPLGAPIHLDSPAGQAFLDKLLAEYKPDVLLVDSVQKITSKPITDEIATKSLTEYFQRTREKHDVSIVGIHHERKRSSERSGWASAGDLSDVYGSTFLAADMDFVSALRRTGTHTTYDEYKNRLGAEKHDLILDRQGMKFVISEANQNNPEGSNISDNPYLGPSGPGDSGPVSGTGTNLDF